MHLSRAPTAILAAAVLIFAADPVAAQTWTGATNASWSNAGNWSPAGVPASDQDTQLMFGATPNGAMTNDIAGTLTLNTLTFSAAAPTYTLAGNGMEFLTSSGGALPQIMTNSPNGVTIGTALTLANNLTVSGAGNTNLSGAVGGAGSLTMAGTGTLALGDTANTYSGGTNVLNGTLQVPADAALGLGNVTGATPGTVNFTGTTTTTKSFAMNGGTVSVAAGQTVTFNGSQISGAYLDGAGTFATSAANGARFIAVTATPSVAISSNSAADQFVHFTNGGSLTVAAGINVDGASTTVNFNGFTNEGAGTITVGAATRINVSNFQSYGTLILDPASGGSRAPTLIINVGTTPLGFNGGSTTVLQPREGPPNSPFTYGGFDLLGQNAIVTGGLFVNDGFVLDSSLAGTATIFAEYGALVKGGGYFQNPVITQNGGKFQSGESPGAASFGKFVFGPGGVNNYVFDINDATGTAGAQARGWGLVKAVQQSIMGTTGPGDFTWTATPAAPLIVNLDTLLVSTTDGDDVAGSMANFDPTRPYSWLAAQWTGTYSGPTDAATLDAATSFDTSGFLNPISGTFGWSLGGSSLSLSYTPRPVPEPGALALVGFAAVVGWSRRRRAVIG